MPLKTMRPYEPGNTWRVTRKSRRQMRNGDVPETPDRIRSIDLAWSDPWSRTNGRRRQAAVLRRNAPRTEWTPECLYRRRRNQMTLLRAAPAVLGMALLGAALSPSLKADDYDKKTTM